jgi:DnaJ-class molecular chaperone
MGFCRDLAGRDLIRCPTCAGSGYEPSVVVSCRRKCPDCRGGGYFAVGRPTRLMTMQEFTLSHPTYLTIQECDQPQCLTRR